MAVTACGRDIRRALHCYDRRLQNAITGSALHVTCDDINLYLNIK